MSTPACSARLRRAVQRARSIEDLRALARARLPHAVFEFYEGGAEDESTLRDNRAAFERWKLVPHVLRGVATVDTRTTLGGAPTTLPIAVSPMGATGFGWPRGDVAIARAAAEAGIPYALSSSATSSIERIARDAPGRHWFQPYMLKDRAFFMRLIDRAEAAGYEALVITVDMPVGGKRERDFRNDFSVPFRYTARNVLGFASCPRWASAQLWHGRPVLENLVGLDRTAQDLSGAASSVGRNFDPDFGWRDLEAVRTRWPRKLFVKGILCAEDAERVAALGVDGVIVSNHGGRQLDGAIATLDALPDIAGAVGHRIEVIIDSGIRRGSDIVKAIALGARAVMIGRAALYGSSAAGEAGAARALQILSEELVRTMQLVGARRVGEIDRRLVTPAR